MILKISWRNERMKNLLRRMTLIMGLVFILGVLQGGRATAQGESGPPLPNTGPANEAEAERADFVKEIRRVEQLNRKYTKEIQDIRALLTEKDADYQKRMQELEGKLATQQTEQAKKEVVKEQGQQTTLELEAKTNEMIAKGDDIVPQDKVFRQELAKAHYNMGNIYFEKGDYQRAVVEYYQAVDLAPNDPDTHYNLGFVSGEYLGDQETALKHYQMYLYLKPDADDKNAVKEKILQAKFSLRSKVDSILDKNEGNYNLTR